MEKLTILTALVASVVVIAVAQTVQITILSQRSAATGLVTAPSGSQGQAASQAQNGAIDTSGMTPEEKMNYEMHGIVPARYGSSGSSALNGLPQQVGGC